MPSPLSRRRFVTAAAATVAAASPAGRAVAATKPSRSKRTQLPDAATIKVSDPADLSLIECAALLQAKKLSSVELTSACLDRIAKRDGATNAFVRVYPEYALELAVAADKRLARSAESARRRKSPLVCGIPLGLKDLYAVKGLPLTASSRVLEGNIATGDSTVWAKLKAAGMVLVGHTHTDEFAIGVGTPQTGNPWDIGRSPGGSSGGSGSALGARLIPAATGTDTGGSLRLPATACGVTSLKPSFGRVSAYGVIPLVWTRDHAGPMGRSAADVALLLSYMAGPDQDDPSTLSMPTVPALYPLRASTAAKPFAGKRFGVVKGEADGMPDATGVLYSAFLARVKDLGGELVAVDLPDLPAGGATGSVGGIAETGAYHQQFGAGAIPKYRTEFGAVITAAIAAQNAPVGDYIAYQRDRTRFMHQYAALFAHQRLDVVVLPGTTLDGATRQDVLGLTVLSGSVPGNVVWANLAGAPALCTPVGRSKATGMPFGVQLGALPGAEAALLQLAIDYQAANPAWAEAPPAQEKARTIPTVKVGPVPANGNGDPTGTDAKHPAFQIVPTLSSGPA